MVRIIPNRLKSGYSKDSPTIPNLNSAANSRSASPMTRNKGDSASPDGQADMGLVLNVNILRVRAKLVATVASPRPDGTVES